MPLWKKLANGLVNPDALKRLESLPLDSAEDFLQNYHRLAADSQFPVAEDFCIIRCAIVCKYRPIIRTGKYLSGKALGQINVLKTGCRSLDLTLRGGIYTCEVTELYGASGSGKTQLCLQLAVTAPLRNDATVLYVDTNGSFSAVRALSLLQRHAPDCVNSEKVMTSIHVQQVHDVFELFDQMSYVYESKKMKVDGFYSNLQLVVIDSIASVLSPVIGYRIPEGYAIMQKMGTLLRRLSVELSLAVVVVNGTATGTDTDPKSALGVHWQSIPHNRIMVRGYDDKKDVVRSAKLITSSRCFPQATTNV